MILVDFTPKNGDIESADMKKIGSESKWLLIMILSWRIAYSPTCRTMLIANIDVAETV